MYLVGQGGKNTMHRFIGKKDFSYLISLQEGAFDISDIAILTILVFKKLKSQILLSKII